MTMAESKIGALRRRTEGEGCGTHPLSDAVGRRSGRGQCLLYCPPAPVRGWGGIGGMAACIWKCSFPLFFIVYSFDSS